MTEESKKALDVVAGTFLVNTMPALVLSDFVASHYFVSLRFIKKFNNAVRDLNHPLRVKRADDRTVNASKVYRSYTLEIGNDSFLINLIPIPMQEMCVIVGIDWLN